MWGKAISGEATIQPVEANSTQRHWQMPLPIPAGETFRTALVDHTRGIIIVAVIDQIDDTLKHRIRFDHLLLPSPAEFAAGACDPDELPLEPGEWVIQWTNEGYALIDGGDNPAADLRTIQTIMADCYSSEGRPRSLLELGRLLTEVVEAELDRIRRTAIRRGLMQLH
jgi:hypothetical protein